MRQNYQQLTLAGMAKAHGYLFRDGHKSVSYCTDYGAGPTMAYLVVTIGHDQGNESQ